MRVARETVWPYQENDDDRNGFGFADGQPNMWGDSCGNDIESSPEGLCGLGRPTSLKPPALPEVADSSVWAARK